MLRAHALPENVKERLGASHGYRRHSPSHFNDVREQQPLPMAEATSYSAVGHLFAVTSAPPCCAPSLDELAESMECCPSYTTAEVGDEDHA